MSVSMAARALLYHKRADAGLVGSVYREDADKGVVFVDRVTVPMVDWGSERADHIRALDGAASGRYLLQLALPDGRIVTENFEIVADKNTEVVVRVPHEGPAEWTSLHAMTGEITAAVPMPSPAPTPAKGARRRGAGGPAREFAASAVPDYAHLRADPEHGFEMRFLAPHADTLGASPLAPGALPMLAALIRADLPVDEAEEALGGGIEIATPVQEEADYALFELVHAGSLGDGAARGRFNFGPGSDLARVYLLAKSAHGASLVCLPAPWTREGEEIEIELLLDKSVRDGPPGYALTIGDPMINTALGYINNGALHEAARLIGFETARDLLFHKISSPLAAAIGGYLLVLGLDRSAYRARSADWKNWVDNLAHWFEWLPDGAILRASLYFVLGDKDRDGAYDALMKACNRGLPFFTFGLRLMLEGLRRFANEGDAEAAQRLAMLEPIAQACDPSRNFLCVDIARRWQGAAAAQEVVAGHV